MEGLGCPNMFLPLAGFPGSLYNNTTTKEQNFCRAALTLSNPNMQLDYIMRAMQNILCRQAGLA